ncbi:MAG: ribonuclease PH [Verrucomicrobia bacterium]|nr:ribonuclease PH [Verrucomicrobiota bacterium]
MRHDGRRPDQLRPLTLQRGIAPHAHGSVLIGFGNTRVICSAMIEEGVPRWMKEQNVSGGWITAEYSMLPYSTLDRKQRDSTRGRIDGRSIEIQRLIGRSLRACVDLEALGQRTLWVDCDVLQADGGTRTAAITGACLAAALAGQRLVTEKKIKRLPLKALVAAVSVGVVDGRPVLDLDYPEDKDAAVDFNLVLNEHAEFVEVQGAGEETTFNLEQFNALIALGRQGVAELIAWQRQMLA